MDKDGRNKNYNKIEYCLGSGLELLSAPAVLAVCQDSRDFSNTVIAFVYHGSAIKINWMI